MKRNFYQFGFGIAVVVLLLAGQAFAQNSDSFAYTVPFDFYAGNVRLPAGQYIVQIPSSAKGLIHLENLNHTNHAMLLTLPISSAKRQSNASLVFHQYGRTYFLSKVWDSVSNSGQNLMESKAEREHLQQAGNPNPIEVAVSKR